MQETAVPLSRLGKNTDPGQKIPHSSARTQLAITDRKPNLPSQTANVTGPSITSTPQHNRRRRGARRRCKCRPRNHNAVTHSPLSEDNLGRRSFVHSRDLRGLLQGSTQVFVQQPGPLTPRVRLSQHEFDVKRRGVVRVTVTSQQFGQVTSAC